MSILVDTDTRVLVQGITGRDGSFHAETMIADGTNVVGGVTPGKGGQEACGVPVVASRIDAFESFASSAAILVPPKDARGFADATRDVLTDRNKWRLMRRAGLRTARRFSERRVIHEIEEALHWALATDVENRS